MGGLVRVGKAGPGEAARIPEDRTERGPIDTRTWNAWVGEGDRLYCGIWSATPGKHRVTYTEWEFCHIIRGEAILTGANGAAERVGPGDAFIIPAGFEGTWETLSPLEKHYVILLPTAD